jgi:hypothetical protein
VALPMTEPKDGNRFYPTQDPQFTIEGGRGGLVKFDDGIRRGQLDWEMLGAGEFDIVIGNDPSKARLMPCSA